MFRIRPQRLTHLISSFCYLLAIAVSSARAVDILPYEEGLVHLDEGEMMLLPSDGSLGKTLTHTDWGFAPSKAFFCNNRLFSSGVDQMAYRVDGLYHQIVRPPIAQIDFFDYAAPYYIAVGSGHMALSTDLKEWTLWKLPIHSPLVGLACMGSGAIILTQDGQMIFSLSLEGEQWSRLDYNSYYDQDISFAGIKSRGDLYYAFGQNKRSGAPIITVSRDSKSWSSREAALGNNTPTHAPAAQQLTLQNAIWDGQQFVLLCNNGWLIELPQCVKCDTLRQEGSESWQQAVFHHNQLTLLSDEGSLHTQNISPTSSDE